MIYYSFLDQQLIQMYHYLAIIQVGISNILSLALEFTFGLPNSFCKIINSQGSDRSPKNGTKFSSSSPSPKRELMKFKFSILKTELSSVLDLKKELFSSFFSSLKKIFLKVVHQNSQFRGFFMRQCFEKFWRKVLKILIITKV